MPVRTSRKNTRIINPVGIETLESRQFLTVAADTIIRPALDLKPAATGSTVDGYSPQQIRSAYGFDQISINGVTGDGSGQTIAIVAAYDDPNIAADLHTFDMKFGLNDPSFQKVSQTGGSTQAIPTDPGWSAEMSLDVEWAHAMAPKANIMLVEANSDSLGNLMTAVDYARHVTDVSVVSMSWGGSEFWGETGYDKYFSTPAGHQGVTFVAASGDGGSWWGPSWPASSPNVLAVGGTSLNLNSSGGYGGETGWRDSGGGISNFEPTPSYQNGVQSTGGRTTPDVSFNADPNTGFAVYDSISYQGQSGWSVIGGTSAGAPQWAALIAIANQGRAVNHLGTLDGTSGTLPMLYALYHDPSAYASNFNDVAWGASSYFLRSHVGYDGVTGLGSPKANMVVQSLALLTHASVATTPTTGQTSSTTPTSQRTVHVRRTVAATPAKSTAIIPITFVSAVTSLSIAGNRDFLTPSLGNLSSALGGGFAAPESIFSSSFFARTSASIGAGMFSDRPVVLLPLRLSAAGGSASAAATGATPSNAIASSIVPVLPEVMAAAPRLFNFARIDFFNAFADAWGALAEESASTAVRNNVKKIRAWTITAAVAALDVALLAYWYARKRKVKQNGGFQVGHAPENPMS